MNVDIEINSDLHHEIDYVGNLVKTTMENLGLGWLGQESSIQITGNNGGEFHLYIDGSATRYVQGIKRNGKKAKSKIDVVYSGVSLVITNSKDIFGNPVQKIRFMANTPKRDDSSEPNNYTTLNTMFVSLPKIGELVKNAKTAKKGCGPAKTINFVKKVENNG